jgi:hypothetical protein
MANDVGVICVIAADTFGNPCGNPDIPLNIAAAAAAAAAAALLPFGNQPNAVGIIGGLDAIFIFSISASCNRFALARRFWNQIFTCVSVKLNDAENSARSAIDKYCFCLNFFSNANNC